MHFQFIWQGFLAAPPFCGLPASCRPPACLYPTLTPAEVCSSIQSREERALLSGTLNFLGLSFENQTKCCAGLSGSCHLWMNTLTLLPPSGVDTGHFSALEWQERIY